MIMSHTFTEETVFSIYENQESKFLTPFQRKALLKHLQNNLQPEYRRRIEIMLMADIGKSQTQICEILGCSQEMARYWMGIAEAGLAHKWNERPIGRPKIVNAQYLERLRELVSNSPRDYGYAFTYWTAQWLSKHLASELGIEISDRTLIDYSNKWDFLPNVKVPSQNQLIRLRMLGLELVIYKPPPNLVLIGRSIRN